MLTRATRSKVHTLLNATVLQQTDVDAPAIIFVKTGEPDTTISRAQFYDEVRAHAGALAARGIVADDLVLVAHTQNLESIFLFWGAMWLGAIPTMFPTLTEKLDPAIYAANMAELVRLSEVKAVFTTDEFALQLAEAVGCPVYGSVDSGNVAPDMPMYHPEPSSIAFLQHSSGTTGLQKGVALSHEAVLNQLASYADALALDESDVIVSWLPLYHDMGLIAGFVMPLFQGIPLVLMSPFDWVAHPAMLLQAIQRYHGTLCWLPNFAYNHMARRVRDRDIEGVNLASMRAFVNCSEPVRQDSHEIFLKRYSTIGLTLSMLSVSYAMAENTFAVTQSTIGEDVRQLRLDTHALQVERVAQLSTDPEAFVQVSCGKPIPGTEVCAYAGDGTVLPEYRVGELAVRSDCMLSEYYRRSDLNPFTTDGWYLTGDMGFLADEEVYVVGRKKDLIINAGKNVYPGDIEAIANAVDGVKGGRAVVFGVPDEREGTELIAIVAEVITQDPQERKRINQELRRRVATETTVTLSYVTLVDDRWLIKTSSGKLARRANRDKWLQERAQPK